MAIPFCYVIGPYVPHHKKNATDIEIAGPVDRRRINRPARPWQTSHAEPIRIGETIRLRIRIAKQPDRQCRAQEIDLRFHTFRWASLSPTRLGIPWVIHPFYRGDLTPYWPPSQGQDLAKASVVPCVNSIGLLFIGRKETAALQRSLRI